MYYSHGGTKGVENVTSKIDSGDKGVIPEVMARPGVTIPESKAGLTQPRCELWTVHTESPQVWKRRSRPLVCFGISLESLASRRRRPTIAECKSRNPDSQLGPSSCIPIPNGLRSVISFDRKGYKRRSVLSDFILTSRPHRRKESGFVQR